MMEKSGYKNPMAVPKVKKVVINTGFGRLVSGKTADEQKKIYSSILEDLSSICGQRPVLTLAKKSIAGFKIRKGMPVGAVVTLRGGKMYEFLEKLIDIVLPRSRDFRGIEPKSVDRKGNLSLALRESTAFPEILPEKSRIVFGLEISVVTTSGSAEKGLSFFRIMGFPIKQ